jgi:hypothetical protein
MQFSRVDVCCADTELAVVRGCNGEFPSRNKKKLPLCSTYAKKKRRKKRRAGQAGGKKGLREDVGKNYDLDLLLISARLRKNDVTSDVCWCLSIAHDWES